VISTVGAAVFIHDKVMFEIYRESAYDRRYRVVYFTELDEHNKDEEIARATAGEHYYDGFLRNESLSEAKRLIGRLLDRLNAGEPVPPEELDRTLADHLA
jgi:hypothetical protein